MVCKYSKFMLPWVLSLRRPRREIILGKETEEVEFVMDPCYMPEGLRKSGLKTAKLFLSITQKNQDAPPPPPNHQDVCNETSDTVRQRISCTLVHTRRVHPLLTASLHCMVRLLQLQFALLVPHPPNGGPSKALIPYTFQESEESKSVRPYA